MSLPGQQFATVLESPRPSSTGSPANEAARGRFWSAGSADMQWLRCAHGDYVNLDLVD